MKVRVFVDPYRLKQGKAPVVILSDDGKIRYAHEITLGPSRLVHGEEFLVPQGERSRGIRVWIEAEEAAVRVIR